jgi:hypothetical protein
MDNSIQTQTRTQIVATELSTSWPLILAGQIPTHVDVFLIIWQERASSRFVDYGFFMSTSEPSPHLNCDAFVVCQTTVPVPTDMTGKRTQAHLRVAEILGANELAKRFTSGGQYGQILDKLAADRSKTPLKLAVEVVSDSDYAELKRIEKSLGTDAASVSAKKVGA